MAARSVSPVRRAITIAMDVLVAVAVACVVHLLVTFFGALASASWGTGVLQVTRLIVLPLGLHPIGSLDVNALTTCLVLLAVEWALSRVRRSV